MQVEAKKRRAAKAVVERDFNAAIDRILGGRPTHQALQKKAASDELKLTYATVALEAGRSRSLIAHENCSYQAVRERILRATEASAAGGRRKLSDKLAELHRLNDDLKRKLDSALDAQLEHFIARQKAERAANKWREAFKRCQATNRAIVPIRNR